VVPPRCAHARAASNAFPNAGEPAPAANPRRLGARCKKSIVSVGGARFDGGRHMARNIVYFDLETQRSAEEVGGWRHINRMGMSLGVTFSTARGEYRIYTEDRVQELLAELQRADLIVGFNILRFDYEVLHGYTPFDLRQLPTLDMMVDLAERLPHRLSLDAIASATFGLQKTAHGMQAIQWFKEGRLLDIAEYCCYDVKLTKMVHEYGIRHGRLYYLNRFGKKLAVPVNWKL
jgi:DEAD/DEAH box helicase domain-containing protein